MLVDNDGSAVDPRGGPCGRVNRADPAGWQADAPAVISSSSELLAPTTSLRLPAATKADSPLRRGLNYF